MKQSSRNGPTQNGLEGKLNSTMTKEVTTQRHHFISREEGGSYLRSNIAEITAGLCGGRGKWEVRDLPKTTTRIPQADGVG